MITLFLVVSLQKIDISHRVIVSLYKCAAFIQSSIKNDMRIIELISFTSLVI